MRSDWSPRFVWQLLVMQNLIENRISSSNTLILNLILSPLYQLRIDHIPQEKWGKAFSILGMKRNNCIRKVLIMMQTHSIRTRSNLSFGCGFREFIFERTRKAKHMQLLCAAKKRRNEHFFGPLLGLFVLAKAMWNEPFSFISRLLFFVFSQTFLIYF